MTGEKECARCGKIKPLNEYGVLRCTSDGYRTWCKQCWKETNQGREQKPRSKAKVIPEDFALLMKEAIKEFNFSTIKMIALWQIKEEEFKALGYKSTDITKGLGKLYVQRNGYKYIGNYRWMKE